MTIAQQRRFSIQRLERFRVVAPPISTRWTLVLGRAIVVFVGGLALILIIDGVIRPNLVLIALSWALFSIAVTGLFALSRLDGRRRRGL